MYIINTGKDVNREVRAKATLQIQVYIRGLEVEGKLGIAPDILFWQNCDVFLHWLSSFEAVEAK